MYFSKNNLTVKYLGMNFNDLVVENDTEVIIKLFNNYSLILIDILKLKFVCYTPNVKLCNSWYGLLFAQSMK